MNDWDETRAVVGPIVVLDVAGDALDPENPWDALLIEMLCDADAGPANATALDRSNYTLVRI